MNVRPHVSFGAPRLALVFMIAMLPVVLAAMAYLTDQVDAHVRSDEQNLVEYGVSSWASDAEAKVEGQADWDDTLLHLGVHFDRNWAHVFVGQFLYDVGGMESAYVVDADGAIIYASRHGEDLPATALAAVEPAAASLITQVREAERRLHASRDFGTTLAKPVRKSSLRLIEGQIKLVTATLVQSDFAHIRLAGPAPIVITVKAMDQSLVRRLSNNFPLDHLRIAPGRQPAPSHEVASAPLLDADGGLIGTVVWTPHMPGRQLFLALLIPVLALLGAFIAAAWLLDRRERKSSDALVASERRARHQAFHDSLTGLPNRALFNETIGQALAALRQLGTPFGLLAIDLDRFKLVNDTYGHATGDELIVAVAARLVSLAGPDHTVARLGGDEFAFVYPQASEALLERKAHDLLAALALPIDLPLGRLFTGASIGGALIDDPAADGGEALREADVALYCAKSAGRGRYCLFEPRMDQERKLRSLIEADLRTALAGHQLTLDYQAQVDAQGRVQSVEALLRWQHPERGSIPPAEFVPIAEECGLIAPLGELVMRQAFADSLRWPDVRVAINVSAMQFRSPDFCNSVINILQSSGADPHRLEFEITEHMLLDKDEHTLTILRALRSLGFTIALDDFGTGYSSLSHLRRHPVDKIKIDRSLITTLGVEPQSELEISAIVRLARALHLDVVAEGVETAAQREALHRAGCQNIQGYLFHRPAGADAITSLLAVAEPQLAGGSEALPFK